jgi:hypothetical protein
MKITKTQLKEIIKEEATKIQKKTILENRKKEIVEQIHMLNEWTGAVHGESPKPSPFPEDGYVNDDYVPEDESDDMDNQREKHNAKILDLIDNIHGLIKNLKDSDDILKSDSDKLFTLAGPFVKALLKIV